MSKKRERAEVDLDPRVVAALAGPPTRSGARLAKNDLVKITVRLPSGLVDQIKQEAYQLTKHKRRGFQDLVAIFLHHGLQAYRSGDLEVMLQERAVDYHIVAKHE